MGECFLSTARQGGGTDLALMDIRIYSDEGYATVRNNGELFTGTFTVSITNRNNGEKAEYPVSLSLGAGGEFNALFFHSSASAISSDQRFDYSPGDTIVAKITVPGDRDISNNRLEGKASDLSREEAERPPPKGKAAGTYDIEVYGLSAKVLDAENLQVGFFVENKGDADITEDFGLKISINERTAVSTFFAGGLKARRPADLPGFVVKWKSGELPGKVKVYADPDDVIEEQDEENNIAETEVQLQLGPLTGSVVSQPERTGYLPAETGQECDPLKAKPCESKATCRLIEGTEFEGVEGSRYHCIENVIEKAVRPPAGEPASSVGREGAVEEAGKIVEGLVSREGGGIIPGLVERFKSVDEKKCEIVPKRKKQVEESIGILKEVIELERCVINYKENIGQCGIGGCEGLEEAFFQELRGCTNNKKIEEGYERLAEMSREIEAEEVALEEGVGRIEELLGLHEQGGKTVTIKIAGEVEGETGPIESAELAALCNGIEINARSEGSIYKEGGLYVQKFLFQKEDIAAIEAEGCEVG